MKITLKEWLEINRKNDAAKAAIDDLERTLIDLMGKHDRPEVDLLVQLLNRVDRMGLLSEIYPQSEWVGGDSGDPKNHKLREPNCCGLSNRRYFTEEEIDEVNMQCHGACDWSVAADSAEA